MNIYNKLNLDLQEKVDSFIWDKKKSDFINDNDLKSITPKWLSFRKFKIDFFDIFNAGVLLGDNELLFGYIGNIKTINGFFKILAECSLKLENYTWSYETQSYNKIQIDNIHNVMDLNKGFHSLNELTDYIINTDSIHSAENIQEYYYEVFDCIRLALDYYCVDINKNNFIEICKLLYINPVYVFDTAFEMSILYHNDGSNLYPEIMCIYLTELLKEIISHYIRELIITLPAEHILIQTNYEIDF